MSKGEESEAIVEYRASLNDLSFNSKPLINMLTMLADDYKDTSAPEIVKCIEKRMHDVSADKKLPLLYLMDSICKNINGVYVKLFTQNIVSTFCHVFEKADEKTRLSLYKLRQTWNDIFPARKLYAVDVRINQSLDPAWPVTAPKPDATVKSDNLSNVKPGSKSQRSNSVTAKQQQVHINPKFLNDAKQVKQQISLSNSQSSVPSTPDTITAQFSQKYEEFLKLQKQRFELALMTEKAKLEVKARSLDEREEKIKQKEVLMETDEPSGVYGKKKGIRKRLRGHRSRSPSPVMRKRSPQQQWNRNPVAKSRSRSPLMQWSPQRQKGPNTSPNRGRGQRSPQMPRVGDNIHKNSSVGASHLLMVGNHAVDASTIPTTIPAPAILAQNDIRNFVNLSAMNNAGTPVNLLTDISSISCAPVTTVVTSVAQAGNVMAASSVVAASAINEPVNWCQDRDYRREFEAMMFEADQRLRSGALSTHDHDVLVREMERAMHQNISHEMAPAFKQENLCVTPELTMLVDGKSRKLYYLDDSVAVVLMNGPPNLTFNDLIKMDPSELNPRLISFEGKPTKVFIDSDRGSNEFVLLEFNNQPQTFFHNEHEQRIKFGGPAKEIVLNGKAYQAKFGGAPVEVWFSGDTLHSHSLRLDGPPPRVKLSEQPRIDLWNQIIHKATKKPDPPKETKGGTTTDAGEPPVNINELLAKLVTAGIINSNVGNVGVGTEVCDSGKHASSPQSSLDDNSQSHLPPEPSLQLTPDSLKLPRPSVVASLYNGIQCTNCSLRFDDKDKTPHPNSGKTNYAKHLDWHFRQNRKDKVKPTASAASLKRGWLYNLALWLQFKEVSDEDDTTSKKMFDEEKESENVVAAIVTVAANSDESLNQCSVCCEKFDLIWVEEEEEWRLKNAVSGDDGKNYHPFCLEDLLKQEQQQQQEEEEGNLEISEKVSDKEAEADKSFSDETALIIAEEYPLADGSGTVESATALSDVEMTTIKEEKDISVEVKEELLEVKSETVEVKTEPKEEEESAEQKIEIPVETENVEVIKEEKELSAGDIKSEVSCAGIGLECVTEREESLSVLKNEKEIKESPLRLEIMPSLVPKENKLTINLKSKLCVSQRETQSMPLAKKEENKVPVIERGVEKSALCVIL